MRGTVSNMETRTDKSDGWRVASLAIALLGIPALYALSIGPAACLAKHGFIGIPFLHAFYRPVMFMADHVQWTQQPIYAWINLWTAL